MLEVETEDKTLPGVPEGYLAAMWHEVRSLEMPTAEVRRLKAIGWVGMLGFVIRRAQPSGMYERAGPVVSRRKHALHGVRLRY